MERQLHAPLATTAFYAPITHSAGAQHLPLKPLSHTQPLTVHCPCPAQPRGHGPRWQPLPCHSSAQKQVPFTQGPRPEQSDGQRNSSQPGPFHPPSHTQDPTPHGTKSVSQFQVGISVRRVGNRKCLPSAQWPLAQVPHGGRHAKAVGSRVDAVRGGLLAPMAPWAHARRPARRAPMQGQPLPNKARAVSQSHESYFFG